MLLWFKSKQKQMTNFLCSVRRQNIKLISLKKKPIISHPLVKRATWLTKGQLQSCSNHLRSQTKKNVKEVGLMTNEKKLFFRTLCSKQGSGKGKLSFSAMPLLKNSRVKNAPLNHFSFRQLQKSFKHSSCLKLKA